MSDNSFRVVEPMGFVIGALLAGVGPAIGAAVADKHPPVGAVVGSAASNTALFGIMAGVHPLDIKESIWPYVLKSTLITGAGGAIGSAVSDRQPALGAFIGAALAAGAGYAIHRLQAPRPVGQVSGAPCDAIARVSAGAFP